MKLFLALALSLMSFPSLGCTIWFVLDDSKSRGEIITSTHKPKVGGSIYAVKRSDYLLYLKLQKEMFLPKYASMSDEQMLSILAKKYKKSSKDLKTLQAHGMVIDSYLKSGKIR